MKRKVLSVMLVGVLSSAILAGCGSKKEASEELKNATGVESTTEDATEDAKEDTTEDAAADTTEDAENAAEDALAAGEDALESDTTTDESASTEVTYVDHPSSDNVYTIQMPSDWVDHAGSYNDQYTVEIANADETAITMVLSEPKADLNMDASGYVDTIIGMMTTDESRQPVLGDKTEITTTAGLSGYRQTVTLTVDSMNLVYYVYGIEGETNFYQFTSFTLPSQQTTYEPIFDTMVQSLVEN